LNANLHIVARERARAAERWPTPVVGVPASGPGTREAPATPTAQEVEAAVAQARAQAQREGHAEGIERGLIEGRQAAQAELEGKLAAFEGVCDALARPLQQVNSGVEQQLAKLATLIAERVIDAELHTQPAQVVAVVRKALAALPAATTAVEIAVPPQLAGLLREGLAKFEGCGWRITEDPRLQPGDCRISGADSRVDATVATRLKALIDAALGAAE
jgi:flagellar assembly protein FliH